MRIIFDIETDALLNNVTRMWVIVWYNIDSKELKYALEGDFSWKEDFEKADKLIGHNIINFDLMVLKKLFDFEYKGEIQDTLLLSQIMDYRRFGLEGHSLERWGVFLNVKKTYFADWTKYSTEMLEYCKQDVNVNTAIYKHLMNEINAFPGNKERLFLYIKAEHAAAMWQAEAALYGWPFDLKAAEELYATLEKEMTHAYDILQDRLGMKSVAVDSVKGVVEEKKPCWTKQGTYAVRTANWFGIDPVCGFEQDIIDELNEEFNGNLQSRPIMGPYCRVEFKHLSLDSVYDVKLFLHRQGWKPTEWNYKKDAYGVYMKDKDGKRIKTSPKITEDSLELLGGDGALYKEFLTVKSRASIVKTWLEEVDAENNLHGECMLIGTPSMRATHSIIVNVPKVGSAYGKEMRELFIAKPGWKLVGADSSGNQARGLAHFLKNEEYTDILLNKDIHTYNANKLTEVLNTMGIDHQVPRDIAKRILYAFLFGASGEKLWTYLFGAANKSKGNILKEGFIEAVPGFSAVVNNLLKVYDNTSKKGWGYIRSLAGNKLYVDSRHKLLVYLLQSTEKITCSTALMLTVQRLKEANIQYIPLIYYHDEIDFMVRAADAEKAAEIAKQSFKDGPALFGVNIMDGEAKIGNNWGEIH